MAMENGPFTVSGIVLLKHPLIGDFPLPCFITRGYHFSSRDHFKCSFPDTKVTSDTRSRASLDSPGQKQGAHQPNPTASGINVISFLFDRYA